jgi:hypothetical protein
VSKSFWQRWVLMLLLVTRLVIGELGHAMPAAHTHDIHAMLSALSLQNSPAVSVSRGDERGHEHEGHHEHARHESLSAAHHAVDSTGAESSVDTDCCKSSKCQCACLQGTCLALDDLVLKPVAITLLRIPQGVESFVSQRPSGLFRPPARFS